MGTPKIEKVKISGLFGRFNYTINLVSNENGINIITAPNGYGKSTILKIISSFASGDLFYFVREKFDSIDFFLQNEEIIRIEHQEEDFEKNQVSIVNVKNKSTIKIKDPFGNNEIDEPSFSIERAFPFLRRIDAKRWIDERNDTILEKGDLLAKYGDHPVFRKRMKRDEWLDKIISGLKVFSISTNRLKLEYETEYNRRERYPVRNFMVETIAKEIQDKIQSAIRTQFEEGRKKETSFPTRLIESLRSGFQPTKTSIMESLKAVQEYEERYSRLGLLPKSGTTKQLNVYAESIENAGMLVLKTYLEDISSKFSLLSNLAERLDVFCNSINSLFTFTSIETSADGGIIAKSTDGKKESLTLSLLSSGEQHLIVLIGKLVFNTDQGTLVLIDEPEISFHPEWQEKFLGILEDIQKLNGFSALVATHSPILIGNRWNDVIELAEQYSR